MSQLVRKEFFPPVAFFSSQYKENKNSHAKRKEVDFFSQQNPPKLSQEEEKILFQKKE